MIQGFQGNFPQIHPTAWVAPSSDVIGRVSIGEDSSIWFQCVLRGDVNTISIGKQVNIQDGTLVHVARDLYPVEIGDGVSIGHKATIHGCRLKNHSFVGMGAMLMDDVELGEWSFVAAGTLVPPGKKIPSGVLVMGSPGKVIRDITEKEREIITRTSANYAKYKENYRQDGIG